MMLAWNGAIGTTRNGCSSQFWPDASLSRGSCCSLSSVLCDLSDEASVGADGPATPKWDPEQPGPVRHVARGDGQPLVRCLEPEAGGTRHSGECMPLSLAVTRFDTSEASRGGRCEPWAAL